MRAGWRLAAALFVLGGCDCGGTTGRPCTTSAECAAGQMCVDGRCREGRDGGRDAAGSDGGTDAGGDGGDLGPCPSDGTPCVDDSRCVGGRCVPWGDGDFDAMCLREAEPGPIRPQLQCTWDGPPPGDPAPTFVRVLHTPLVANLRIVLDPDIPPRPNVVFISDGNYMEGVPRVCQASGTLRVIDGATCRELTAATAEDVRVNSPVTPAIGDLDADGRPDIVAARAEGGVIAFRVNAGTNALEVMWRSHNADGSDDLHGSTTCMWGGVSLYDLDDDGRPEVILDGAVWSPDGVRLATIPGWVGFPHGVPAPVADVDLDGRPEVVAAEGTWEWTGAAFVREAYSTDSGLRGFSALADFGDFPAAAGDGPGRPEVVVAAGGAIVVQSIGGTELGRVAVGSTGGPPTVADYDGDGAPEVGAAFAEAYGVFDVGMGRLLWSQPSQDLSSARTGSSVFDFNGDGRAEVVYGDECYVRVYDGMTGDVLFSQARFSSTWTENPIVADVDGDFAAEIVMGMSGPCNPGYCPPVDPLFAGLRCDEPGDCPGGSCDAGLCRCTTDADCGLTYGCTDALAGTPGTGQVCRAFHRECEPGLRVYRDARDRWAASRPIWNQHAYHVTNVEDDGTIPRTSAIRRNWEEEGLNNFRQNVQGDLTDLPGADLTVGMLRAICEGEDTRLTALVCNRGGALLDAGVEVIFRQPGGDELCRLRTTEPVPPGICTEVSCVASVQAEGIFEAVVDPDEIIAECIEDNNRASGEADCLL
jgi:hypothetical protein